MTEPPEQLRLWTFYEPMAGPMAVDINGCYFECEAASIERSCVEGSRVKSIRYDRIVGYDYDLTVTFKLRVRSKQDPSDIVYQVEDVPPSVRLL